MSSARSQSARLSKVALLKVKLQEGIDTSNLFGSRDVHLKMIEDAFGIRVSARGEEVLLEGPIEGVRGGERLIGGLTSLMKEGMVLRPDDVEFAIRTFQGGEGAAASKDSVRGEIEIAPLAFMRGRTLNDSFVILDEAQNATSEQMKMFLTRLGFNSKAVVTGDITQVDLPRDRVSGLIEVRDILAEIPGIAFVYFTEKDVVRHRLVQDIIKAYERHSEKSSRPKTSRRVP